jgi:hypothetical protein
MVFNDAEYYPHNQQYGCPMCGSDYELAKECPVCGEYFADEELIADVCDDCIAKYEGDLEMCLKIGALDTDKVAINCCISSLLDEDEINSILADYLRKVKDISCEEFIYRDKYWFAEQLAEVKKDA